MFTFRKIVHIKINHTCLQDWWDTNIVYFTWMPRALLAIIIAVEEEVYARIARWLNDKGNAIHPFVQMKLVFIL